MCTGCMKKWCKISKQNIFSLVLPLNTVALQAMASPVRFPTAAEEECPAAAAPPAAASSRDPVRSSLHSWS